MQSMNAIGLMSGTSMDGIDVAMISSDGEHHLIRGPFMSMVYAEEFRARLAAGISQAVNMRHACPLSVELISLEKELTRLHAIAVETFVQKFNISMHSIDLIGMHGHTILHRPDDGVSIQLGDGVQLARTLGKMVVYDMRKNDILHGGEGAPLVPVYHRVLAAMIGEQPLAIVNIGGVANVTFIGRQGELMAFDTGPGNGLLDDWIMDHTGKTMDKNGQLSMTGTVNQSVLAIFLADDYFTRTPPKSLDRNHFSRQPLKDLNVADGARTLCAFTASSIAASTRHIDAQPEKWIICGGGRHNPVMMTELNERLSNVIPAESMGFDGDCLEAEAFAYLAIRSLRGLPLSYPDTTGCREPLRGGLIAKP